MKKDDKKSNFDPKITEESSILRGGLSGALEKGHAEDKLLKKRKNEPADAANNLDIPGASVARTLTNNRHQKTTYKPTSLKKSVDTLDTDKNQKK